jgi:hypothetical protein
VPVAIHGGRLYYAPFKSAGALEIMAKEPSGRTTVAATAPSDVHGKPLQWVNGIAGREGGPVYFTENTAVRRLERDGSVSTAAANLKTACPDPLPGAPGLPHLRGLDVDARGNSYVAANGCRSVLKIAPSGEARVILTSEAPWSPTGVAVFRGEVFVLEFDFSPVPGREWPPRVRKIHADGTITTLATIPKVRPR